MDPCNNTREPKSRPEAMVKNGAPDSEEAKLTLGPPGAIKAESNKCATIQEDGGIANILTGHMPAGAGDREQEQDGKEQQRSIKAAASGGASMPNF